MSATDAVLGWDWPGEPTLHAADSGLINLSFVVHCDGEPIAVLQRLNTDIFTPLVHEDIEAVTVRLEERGVPTPRLLRTRAGALWHEVDGEVWRCLNHLGDRTAHKVHALEDARSAAALVARFHTALRDFDWQFRSVRPGAHDTHAHMDRLENTLRESRTHRLFSQVEPLADTLLTRWNAHDGPAELPLRVVHGDLKISNVRFAGAEALCLIDLDTMAWGRFDAEMGDAMRSWCNPATEDDPTPRVDLDIFRAAMQGYASAASKDDPSAEEWASIAAGTERICLELAARFAWDALAECYFGWDPRFGGRGEHNLVRAKGQLALAQAVRETRPDMERILRESR